MRINLETEVTDSNTSVKTKLDLRFGSVDDVVFDLPLKELFRHAFGLDPEPVLEPAADREESSTDGCDAQNGCSDAAVGAQVEVRRGEPYAVPDGYFLHSHPYEISQGFPQSHELPAWRGRCAENFLQFCVEYFHHKCFDWRYETRRIAETLQDALISGTPAMLSVGRGKGTTTLCTLAAQFAVTFRSRANVLLLVDDREEQSSRIDNLHHWLTDGKYARDFADIAYPFQCAARIAVRAKYQKFKGRNTGIEFGPNYITLPFIEGTMAGGGRIVAESISSWRNVAVETMDLVIVDTDGRSDGGSKAMNQKREGAIYEIVSRSAEAKRPVVIFRGHG